MSATAIYLLTATCFFVTSSLGNISDNGWRPMSNEKVAELQNFIKHPRNIPSYLYTDIRLNRGEYQRRTMQTQPTGTEQYIGEYDTVLPYSMIDLDSRNQPLSHAKDPEHPSDLNNKQFTRKAKNIDVNTQAKINSIKDNDQDINESNKNIYEVTEDIKEDVKHIDEKQNKFGYYYIKPKINVKSREQKNNFTRNLLSILANYNIRTSDNLPNYDLSLRHNSRDSDQGYVYMNVPLRIPLSQNSLNHIPVDSLLAVFLSNYGIYLPGLYGFQRNYNNLYGYLASNNIHNNKPFGSYKLFSDTDSYH